MHFTLEKQVRCSLNVLHLHGHELWPTDTHAYPIPPAPFPGMLVRRVIYKLPDATPNHVRRQYEMAYQLVLKSCQFPSESLTWPPPPLFPFFP